MAGRPRSGAKRIPDGQPMSERTKARRRKELRDHGGVVHPSAPGRTLTPYKYLAAKSTAPKRLTLTGAGHTCVDCGEAPHWAALDFDHLPGFEKIKEVGRGDTIANAVEVNKCQPVCANCHRVRTYERHQGLLHDGADRPDLAAWVRSGVPEMV